MEINPKEIESSPRPRPRSRKGAPGILDVALRAGVSGATVSRYFNQPSVVRPQTRGRIERAARELGYIRDRMAGVLHGKMSGTVGLIVPTIDNAIFSELIEAFSAHLHEHDRTMLIASHSYDLDTEVSLVRSLLERRIDAIALVGRDHSLAALEMIKLRQLPAVSLWNTNKDSGMTCIGTDNFRGAVDITQHILSLQHTKIALLFPDTRFNDRARDRKAGVSHALNLADVVVPSCWDLPCPYDMAAAKSVALELLGNEQRPTALICANDVIAHGVIHAASRLKLQVPDDISVVGIGDFKGSSAIEPPLTTVRLPARRIGQLAASVLIDKITKPSHQTTQDHLIPAKLVVRESTCLAKSAI